MKKIIPLIFSVFYFQNAGSAQAVGGWGTCEFATVAAMNAFDPSTNAYDCKKVFVQATDEHYHWDGTQWVVDGSDVDNIYRIDGTLQADRTVTMGGNTLIFDGTGTGDVIIEEDGDVGIGTITPGAKLDVEGGQVRFSDYGTGTYDDASPARILGVQIDGDVVEVNLSFFADTDDQNASEVPFTPAGTISSTDVQAAVEEIEPDIYGSIDVHSDVDITTTAPVIGDYLVWDGASFVPEDLNAANVTYDNFTSGLTATDVQDAIDELAASGGDNLGDHVATENLQMDDFWISNDGDDEGIFVLANGNVGIGTNTPSAAFEVASGKVMFSSYGNGSNTATNTYVLSVDVNGAVSEMNTVASSRVFNPPAMAVSASSIGTGFTLNLHTQYQNLFNSPAVKSPSGPATIPSYASNELDYYITDYDTSVFANVTISDAGLMTYDVISVPTDNCSFMNVVFLVK